MKIQISPNGPKLSQITFGTMRMLEAAHSPSDLQKNVEFCLEKGVTTFDLADIYGGYQCEEVFGQFLKLHPTYKQKIEIVSKCGIALLSPNRPQHFIKHYNYSTKHIRDSVENSLKKLNVDSLDLVLFHRPSPLLNPDEVAAVSTELTQQGKVKFWGVSNFTPAQYKMLASRMKLHTNQVEVNPLNISAFLDGTLDLCVENKISPMFWSPLAGGRIFKPQNEKQKNLLQTLEAVSKKMKTSVDGLVYSWLMQHPSRPVIVLGTNKMERVQNAAESLALKWDIQDWFQIWQSALGSEVP